MLDLVAAVILGPGAALLDPRGIPTSSVTALPLSIIPTFVVSLLFIPHIICIAQALRWPAQVYSRGIPANSDSTSALSGADV